MNITSVRFGTVESISSCEGYYWQIQYHRRVIVMLRPSSYVTGGFAFDFINLQGPFFYLDKLKGLQVTRSCHLVSAAAWHSRMSLRGMILIVTILRLVIGIVIL